MKKAYLTIDDAPSPDMKEKVDVLVQHNIPCVWFCQGSFLEERPECAVYALQHGHIIGNHAYSHTKFSDLSLGQAIEEIERTDAIIQSIYKSAEVEWAHKFFRFPYGDKGDFLYGNLESSPSSEGAERKQALQAYLRLRGYVQPHFPGIQNEYHRNVSTVGDIDWRWTFDVLEYSPHCEGRYGCFTMDEVFARMDADDPEKGRTLNTDGSDEIILVHDHSETSQWFPQIIETLCQKNLHFSDARDLCQSDIEIKG